MVYRTVFELYANKSINMARARLKNGRGQMVETSARVEATRGEGKPKTKSQMDDENSRCIGLVEEGQW